jgi:hypothetical protein
MTCCLAVTFEEFKRALSSDASLKSSILRHTHVRTSEPASGARILPAAEPA